MPNTEKFADMVQLVQTCNLGLDSLVPEMLLLCLGLQLIWQAVCSVLS